VVTDAVTFDERYGRELPAIIALTPAMTGSQETGVRRADADGVVTRGHRLRVRPRARPDGRRGRS
jgi:hypothetical protein